jgi:membrane protein
MLERPLLEPAVNRFFGPQRTCWRALVLDRSEKKEVKSNGFAHLALGASTDAVKRFFANKCTMLAASIAFYSAFSLSPTLLIVLAVAGWFFGADAARGRLFDQVRGILGNDAASAMQSMVEHAHHAAGSGLAATLSVVLLLVGASATFSSLNTALDIVFPPESKESRTGLTLLVRARVISLGMVLGVGFLLVVSLVLDAAITFAGHAVFGNSPLLIIASIVQTLLGLLILSCAFALLIKWLPDTHVPLWHASVGGVAAAILFTIGRHLFGLYLAHAGTANSFGAAGSLAVLMMWLYFSAAVFLLGAEVAAAMRGKQSERVGRQSTAADNAAARPLP